MKRHADIGADLLSSIKFPYPVVPIVRYHHEFWNGGGYPAGISGTDIPLGARILSVVDCFDALTSDRPYRPRLTDAEAFEVLRERRGTMYDPLIVDTFIAVHSEIAPAAIKAGQEARSIMNVDRLTLPDEESALKSIRENASETALLSDFERQLNTTTDGREVIEVASQLLRRLTPATVYAFYRYSVQQDSLTCECTAGDDQRLLEGLTIPLGQRVTGWSGVNQRTSLNSNASLDLGQLSEMFDPPLQSSLSTPVLRGEQLVGVLTVYSPRNDAFSEAHRYYVEYASASLSRKLASPGKPLTKTVVTFPRSRIKR